MSWMREWAGKRRRTTALFVVAGLVVTAGGAVPAAATGAAAVSPIPDGAGRGAWTGSTQTGDYGQSFSYATAVWPTNPAPGATIHVRSELTYVATGPCDPEPGPIPGPRTDPTGQTTWPAYRIAGVPAPSRPWESSLGATSIAPMGTPLSTQSQSWGCGIHTEKFILDGDYVAPQGAGCYSIAGLNDSILTNVSGDGTWAAFCLKGKNTPPVAVDDPPDAREVISYESALDGRAKRIDVLSNDTDEDGDRLRVTKVTQPRYGRVAIKGGNAVTYTPPARGVAPPQWNGIESFRYTVSDGRGGTDVGRVRVSVAAGDCGPIRVKLTLLDPSDPIFTMEHSTVVCSTPTGTRVMAGTMKPQGLGADATKVKITQADVSGTSTSSVLTTAILYCQDAYTERSRFDAGLLAISADDETDPEGLCISVTWKSVVSARGANAQVTSRLAVQVPPASYGADTEVSLQGQPGLKNDATCVFARGSWRCRL